MKVLFLDMDGVLNNKQHFLATKNVKVHSANSLSDADLFAMKRDTASQNAWVLGYILDTLPDLKIVISSSWRLHYSLESFKELFKILKLDGSRIIGKTAKKLSSERDMEIRWWLEDNTCVTEWIAVDDHVVFNTGDLDKVNEHLTDSWLGLTMYDAFKIIKHFKSDYKEPEFYI